MTPGKMNEIDWSKGKSIPSTTSVIVTIIFLTRNCARRMTLKIPFETSTASPHPSYQKAQPIGKSLHNHHEGPGPLLFMRISHSGLDANSAQSGSTPSATLRRSTASILPFALACRHRPRYLHGPRPSSWSS